jgi:putative sigma-54 modulation protein
MDIRIQAKNIDLNPHAEQYIQKKFERLRRHLPNLDDAKMEVSRTQARSTRDRIQAQMTLNIAGYTLRGQDRGVNLFAAVDSVTDVVDRQIRRFKGKVYHSSQAKKSRSGFRDIPPEAIIDMPDTLGEEEALEEIGRVVRTKRHSMPPMSVEDAILQMEMLGHSFFLFFNMDTGDYSVAYRRHDGDYGMIEPELD